jgi:GTP-binding protein HflX
VLAEIGAAEVAELIVLNKADIAPAEQLLVLQSQHPDAVVVSARTGAGIEQLRSATEARLPKLEFEVKALIPYERGDLIDRLHRVGEFLTSEHTPDGTLVLVRVNAAMAGELGPYEVAGATRTR